MITFHVQPRFRKHFQKYEESIYQLYEYMDNLIENTNDYYLQVDFDVISDQNQPYEYDAYTIIHTWNTNHFPAYSSIYVCPEEFQSKKHFYYTILHELFHALGIMHVPDRNVRWLNLINQEKHLYVGNGTKSRAICRYSQMMNRSCHAIPLQSDEDHMTDFHHLTPLIKDVFSSPLHYRVSPVTIGLLEDYGYRMKQTI